MSSPPPEVRGTSVAVEFDVEDGLDAAWDEPRILELVRSIVASELHAGDYTVTLHLVGDESIRALNAEHRGKDVHTDVLSFPLHDPNGMRFVLPPDQPASLGDVVVSYPRVLEQAAEFGHPAERELGYLVAHGMLHLLGFDHEQEDERRRMRQREESALVPLGFTR
jgi:probable rRNA maturation factor